MLTLPIEPSPAMAARVWKVTIAAAGAPGRALYRDEGSRFVGTLNVYWAWDEADRVWLYNSDDGAVWSWTPRNGGRSWDKARWEGPGPDGPPAALYPKHTR